MSVPILVFHHALFHLGDPPVYLPAAESIAGEMMHGLQSSGLWDAASEMHVGINGGKESRSLAKEYFPTNAHVTYHGLESRNENSTIALIEERLKTLEGEAYVLYQHQKGSSWPLGHKYTTNWRRCMMLHLVAHWTRCVRDLAGNAEAVGCHWFTPPRTPEGQFIFGGNFWWAKASFLRTLPPIRARARIQQDGIHALSSRFEAEVWLGNGPRPPLVVDYHRFWMMTDEPHAQ